MVRTDAARRLIWLGAERDGGGAGGAAPADPVQFEVDRVLTPAEDQAAVYAEVAQPVVEAVSHGATGCIMCYGQTGAGKTYTLAGGGGGDEDGGGGIVERTLRQLLPAGAAAAGAAPLRMAYVQVYMELLQDLVRPESAVQLTLTLALALALTLAIALTLALALALNPNPNPNPRYEQSVEGLRLVNYDTQGRPFRHTLRVTPVRSRSAHDVRPRAVGGRQ